MRCLFLSTIFIFLSHFSFGKEFTIFSPDKNIKVEVKLDSKIGIIAQYQSYELFKLKDISLEIEGEDFSSGIKKNTKAETNFINRKLYPPIKEIEGITTDGYCCLPALVKKPNGMNVVVLESDLEDYPGLWLRSTGCLLKSAHAGYPGSFKYGGSTYGNGQV